MKNATLEEIAQALQQYSSILTGEAEKLEILGVKPDPDLFEKAGRIWGLSEYIIECNELPSVG